MQIRVAERWLDEGWSPWRIGYGAVGLVATGAAVYGYAAGPHHPDAVWWLLAAVAVVAVWALLEAARWRIKYRRLLATRQASASGPRTKSISQLLGEGKALQADIASVMAGLGALRVDHSMTGSLPGKITRWETSVADALIIQPEIHKLFENAPKISTMRLLSWQAYSRIEYQLIILETVTQNPATGSDVSRKAQATLQEFYTDSAKRLFSIYEQGHKLRAILGSSSFEELKDLGNPDLANDISSWEISAQDSLIYWPDQYVAFYKTHRKLVFEYAMIREISEQMDKQLSILHETLKRRSSITRLPAAN